MSITDVVRAWKDEYYRGEASPDHPAGLVELSREELETVAGGMAPIDGHTEKCCHCMSPC
ncbi:mersacidin/lichenicidin family type 2 lantibiotic [Micromonospora peucetia]|uniref:Mersacidin/lichenicidin family type 2 lantibiotic n=1 Tax=Micromonospora peucetia TaxID=47871 RepID=A0A1C6W6B7_9ACTN|nr:mersacidin/lichenicidin family type 2 lantibiotic [Micromonospora peucetia]MCX4385686.1 mersacidin/lichenicidin family type 2 lantibiotic [Micromonospora peucetia]WSA33065.1 mersacidin/lichenicidin family type 2 lantibiotic [Micromonospora peucetia]SCL74082.1 type 2 lantibiotic, mersacidin/lichenicidin family [Micromonospora peucetia]